MCTGVMSRQLPCCMFPAQSLGCMRTSNLTAPESCMMECFGFLLGQSLFSLSRICPVLQHSNTSTALRLETISVYMHAGQHHPDRCQL